MVDNRRFVRTVPAARCEQCGSDHQQRHVRRGLICGDCSAPWPRYQVGP